MSHKTFTQVCVFILILLAFLAIPINTKADGACGGTYTVQQDETIDTLAATCGTSTSAIYAANPGISGNLYAGQVLTIPSSNCPNCAPNNTNCAQGNCAPSYSNCNQGNCAPSYYNCNQGNCAQSYSNCYQSNCAPSYSNCAPGNCAPAYYNCNQGNCAPTSTNGTTYVVQDGDTFGDIANRFGVSMNDLWRANPDIGDVNLLYPGQILNIPSPSWSTPVPTPPWYGPQYGSPQYEPQYGPPQYGSQSGSPWYGSYPPPSWYGYAPTPTEISTPLSYGKVSSGAPMANIELSNKANADVYVSLQGTARDGTNIIREYPVSGTFDKTIPAGFYYYVAYVGGQEYSGAINLPGGSSHSITFHSHEVDAQ